MYLKKVSSKNMNETFCIIELILLSMLHQQKVLFMNGNMYELVGHWAGERVIQCVIFKGRKWLIE